MYKFAAQIRFEVLSMESEQMAQIAQLSGREAEKLIKCNMLAKLVRDGFRSEVARRRGAMVPFVEYQTINC